MTLQEFIRNPKLITEYKRWINSDIGSVVVSVLQETFCRPTVPSLDHSNEHSNSVALGDCNGAWKVLDALRGLDSYTVRDDGAIEPTYGAETEEERDA